MKRKVQFTPKRKVQLKVKRKAQFTPKKKVEFRLKRKIQLRMKRKVQLRLKRKVEFTQKKEKLSWGWKEKYSSPRKEKLSWGWKEKYNVKSWELPWRRWAASNQLGRLYFLSSSWWWWWWRWCPVGLLYFALWWWWWWCWWPVVLLITPISTFSFSCKAIIQSCETPSFELFVPPSCYSILIHTFVPAIFIFVSPWYSYFHLFDIHICVWAFPALSSLSPLILSCNYLFGSPPSRPDFNF